MSEATELYERDFHAWAQDQAALLRAWPEALRPNALDIANLAEEIETLGRSERRAAGSLMLQIVLHLLKLRCHPNQTTRSHWQVEIDSFRHQLRSVFQESPSLRARRAEIAAGVWEPAARLFSRELNHIGLDSRIALAWLPDPAEPYFDLDREILADDWFPPPPTS